MTERPEGREPQPRGERRRRVRTLRETLGVIILGFELIVVFLCTLALSGLRALPPAVAFGAGGALLALMLVNIWALRFPWGIRMGWATHAVITLSGLVHGAMFFVGGVFLATWAYCMVRGGRIEAERARTIAEHERALADGGDAPHPA